MAKKDGPIEIAPLNIKKGVVRIKGVTPILTNRFSDKALETIAAKQEKKATGTKEARDPEEEFLAARYLMNADHAALKDPCGVPAIGIKKMLVMAGMRFTEAQGTQLKGAINIQGTLMPNGEKSDLVQIKSPAPTKHQSRVVLSGRGRTTSIAYRPAFWPWTMDVPFSVNEDIISVEQLVNLFSVAGWAIGVGSWRIEQNGTFGEFVVEASK